MKNLFKKEAKVKVQYCPHTHRIMYCQYMTEGYPRVCKASIEHFKSCCEGG